MSERFYAGAYWPARAETAEACAARAATCLAKLGEVDPLLATWFHKGGSPKLAQRPFPTDTESLVGELLRGRNRRDSDRSVIVELGFRISAWNGNDKDPAAISIGCGKSRQVPGVSNAVVINLPPPSERSAEIYSREGAMAVLLALVESWDPDWATVASDSLRDLRAAPAGSPVLGWLTYLSRRRGTVPAGLPAPFDATPVGTSGSIVSVSEEPPPPDSQLILALERHLGPKLLRKMR
jgi:hypothetical protein